ncbi:MAG: nucleotidyltransferase family protein [Nitratireductor sp.]
MEHLRYAGLSHAEQLEVFRTILKSDPLVWHALQHARELDLPDWLIVSGALYNTVWNALTGKPSGYGIRDIDQFYFDGEDLSNEAEDLAIRNGNRLFGNLAVPVEIRNQARVHLWYRQRFGRDCPRYGSSSEALEYFASKTHALGVALDGNDRLKVVAPFGLEPVFAFRVEPNHALDNCETHMAKAERARAMWPEVTMVPW